MEIFGGSVVLVGRDGMGVDRIDGEASLESGRSTDESGIKVEMKDAVVQ